MDSLKALLAKKKAEKQDLVGDKKYVRRGELEEAKLKRIREEEEQERLAKVRVRLRRAAALLGRPHVLAWLASAADPRGQKHAPQKLAKPNKFSQEKRRKHTQGGSGAGGSDASAAGANGAAAAGGAPDTAAQLAAAASKAQAAVADAATLKALQALSRAEVFRRLRALKQPVTLFGEDDGERVVRLARIQKDSALLDDEARDGGQQENTLLAIQRESKMRRKKGGGGGGGDEMEGGGGGGGGAAEAEGPADAAAAGGGDGKAGGGGGGGGGADDAAGAGGGELGDAFAAAARRLAEQRAEEAMVIEDRIAKYLRKWCREWGEDLEGRSEEAKASGPGHQATMVYKQSMRFMEPLWRGLEARGLEDELKVCLVSCPGWMGLWGWSAACTITHL
jgi:hypothetical protein